MTHRLATLITLLLAAAAQAVVVEQSVTAASVKEKDSKFSVTAETHDDGLVHFTITYRLSTPEYLVAHLELRDANTIQVKTDTPSFAREPSAIFYLAVHRKRLPDASFHLS